jgi:hypothetical protein
LRFNHTQINSRSGKLRSCYLLQRRVPESARGGQTGGLGGGGVSSWIQALAATLITMMEGAHVLCRAAGTLEPFEQTVRTALSLVRGRTER